MQCLGRNENVPTTNTTTLVPVVVYFERANANRLTDDYGTTRDDSIRSLDYSWLQLEEEEERTKATTKTAAPNECRHLETAELEARTNRH